MAEAKAIRDSPLITKDLTKMMPKTLFDHERKALDLLQENGKFALEFVQDFEGGTEPNAALIEKYEKRLGFKAKKAEKPQPKVSFEEVIEKTVTNEEDFARNRQCVEAVEKDERWGFEKGEGHYLSFKEKRSTK